MLEMKIEFIKASEKDKVFLLELRKKTMVEHLEKAKVYLSDQEHMDRINTYFEGAYLIEVSHKKAGLLKYKETVSTIEILQLQIHPDYQGNGIGKNVIEKMIKVSKDKKKGLELKVLKENPAKKLYERVGFEIIGEDTLEFLMRWIS